MSLLEGKCTSLDLVRSHVIVYIPDVPAERTLEKGSQPCSPKMLESVRVSQNLGLFLVGGERETKRTPTT